MIWDELTTTQLDQISRNIPVLLVVAATEQHGSHLPLATDRLIGEHFAQALHKAVPDKILVLPSVAVGCSNHHMDFPGSLSLSHEGFVRQVTEIIASVLKHGFTNIILLNSHGGNQAAAQLFVEKMGYENPKANLVLATWWRIGGKAMEALNESGPGGTGHAGEFETSLMLYIAPHLVHMDQQQKGAHNDTFPWAEGDMLNGPQVSYYRTMKEMTANGVFGDPGLASAKKGEQITVLVVNALRQITQDMLTL
ncbi:creatininase family protein [Spongiimicrobium sp. 3-5]|uniref:creatininase family protein n=1 Tax=Spongiimicrobium sp. 3-5 TaxID=3332596 RepID=UPI003980E6E2